MAEQSDSERLEREIVSESEAKARALTDRAERIARRIARQAAADAAEVQRETEARVTPMREAEVARQVSLVDLEIMREKAVRRETIAKAVYEAARERLALWRSRPDADQIMSRLVREGVLALGGGEATVEMPETDLARWGGRWLEDLSAQLSGEVGRQVRLTARPASELGLVSADGRARVDQDLNTRLDRLWEDLRRILYEEIFTDKRERN